MEIPRPIGDLPKAGWASSRSHSTTATRWMRRTMPGSSRRWSRGLRAITAWPPPSWPSPSPRMRGKRGGGDAHAFLGAGRRRDANVFDDGGPRGHRHAAPGRWRAAFGRLAASTLIFAPPRAQLRPDGCRRTTRPPARDGPMRTDHRRDPHSRRATPRSDGSSIALACGDIKPLPAAGPAVRGPALTEGWRDALNGPPAPDHRQTPTSWTCPSSRPTGKARSTGFEGGGGGSRSR